jgi:CRP-like cAMP-binding protein
MDFKTFEENEIIIKEGSKSEDMYLIMTGKARVFKIINAEKVELAVLEHGDFIGEMSLFLNESRTANVEAIETTEVQIINKNIILEEIKVNPEFAYDMILMLANRIKNLHQIISNLQGVKKSYEIMYKKK